MKRLWPYIIGGMTIVLFFIFLPAPAKEAQMIDIKKGATLSQVSEGLEEKGLVRSSTFFKIYVWISGDAENIQAGRFEIPAGAGYGGILEHITAQAILPSKITFPEGYTIKQMDALLVEKGFIQKGEFEKCAKETCKGKNLEGFLFPDTYFLDYGSFSVESFTDLLLNTFDKKVSQELQDDILKSGRTIQEIIIMASILEKEVRHEEDLEIVSGILWKRLDADWGLDADATLLYDRENNDRDITQKDLQSDSPYNTRKWRGLPPTPIGNPGLKTIMAALHPEKSEYWFYLSKSDGTMVYARTNEEHNQNKALYLK